MCKGEGRQLQKKGRGTEKGGAYQGKSENRVFWRFRWREKGSRSTVAEERE